MSSQPGPGMILSMYRQVLKLHREKLPPAIKDFGDSYAKAEFKSHLKGKTTRAQWEQFVEQWTMYLDTLQGKAQLAGGVGPSGELPGNVEGALSPDQKRRLQLLREEIDKSGKAE